MGKFRQFLTELQGLYFHFQMITLVNVNWIFTRLGVYIIVEICFGIADGQFH